MTFMDPGGKIVDQILGALGMNAPFVLGIHALYVQNPEAVSREWRGYFEGLARGEISPHELPDAPAEATGNGAPGTAVVNGAKGTPPVPHPSGPPPEVPADHLKPLLGGSALIAQNMNQSVSVPTATSYREVPVKVLEENRRFLNLFLSQTSGGKISFTHLVSWAMAEALREFPAINDGYAEVEGRPHRIRNTSVNLGVAVDLERKDGSRNLLVPNIPGVESMSFDQFAEAYNEVIRKVRKGQIEPSAFQGTTITLTNPGTVGTASSVPRLMEGQGAIIAVGAIGYSAETRAMSPELLTQLGISKHMTVSCTYDHRIIQGAASGQFLGRVEELLQGEHDFYDRIYEAMGVPYHPVRGVTDVGTSGFGDSRNVDEITRQARVLQLINAYRVRGHLIANLDPLGSTPSYHPELDIQYYGLTLWDLDRSFITGDAGRPRSAWETPQVTLREILETLRTSYCGTVGVEYMNIQDPEQKRWIQERVEPHGERPPYSTDTRRWVLDKLYRSEIFEKFLHTRFLGHKRFSLEGSETLIPILHHLLDRAAADGAKEVVVGMSHRGRLNVLAQTVGVDPASIFAEFQGSNEEHRAEGSGDVKYHLGATGTHRSATGRSIEVSISPNPSHLEAVDPVVEGIARAKQERVGAEEGRKTILPVLIHGDAAFAGQGVVAETLNLSQLKGYRTGGTIHIIVNNQIGFTTPVESARSSPYPTDVAKMGQAPIFHVNGDDPEAAIRVLEWALAFRQKFEKDVVIDMFCYRRHGHNEGDEPSYTQPRLYAKIRNHPSSAELYGRQLVREGVLSADEVKAVKDAAHSELEDAYLRAAGDSGLAYKPMPLTEVLPGPAVPRSTAVPLETLAEITRGLTRIPEGLDLNPKLEKWLEQRTRALETGEGIEWAYAEALAFGSLSLEGVPVRLSGQDSVRGTFSQRHLMFRDDDTDLSWIGLQNLRPQQAPFIPLDSPLSEESVLGFEYGYSIGDPSALVLWEAQFGDFVNEAQVVIDQFIAGSMAKWGQPSSVVLLLPHGYEGQGPDHSSARLERFLQLAAEDNIQVTHPTTPAQYFHLLRRQMCRSLDRKPLVIMTPKSLLRHPRASSRFDELTGGDFREVLVRKAGAPPRRVVLCSGKVYYDLEAALEKDAVSDVTLARVEQLYPFPEESLRELLGGAPGAEVVWAQEEPRNMGGWMFMQDRLLQMGFVPRYVGRRESASTATGYLVVHRREQAKLVEQALAR